MNSITGIFTSSSVPRWLATAAVAISLLIPLSARADHDRNQTLEIIAGAAIAYAIFDAAGTFDDDRRHHKYNRHGYHRYGYEHDGYYQNNRYGKHHNRHYKAKRQHKRHDNHGYRNKHHNRYKRHDDRYSDYRH